MNLLFVGLGSIGRRHATLIFKHFPQYEIYALRSGYSENNLPFVCNLYNWYEVDLINFDAAFICNPTDKHIDSAIQYAARGMHLFVEKPLSVNLDNLQILKNIVSLKNLTCYVAYPFRHHPDLKAIKKIIGNNHVKLSQFECLTWLPAWNKPYSMKKETGGGALLELSHEIDMAQYLCGRIKQITGVGNKVSEVTEDCEDQVRLTLLHETGAESYLRLDLSSRRFEKRTIEIMTENYHGIYDLNATKQMFYARMYLNQLQYFFDNLGNVEIENNLFEAADLFEKIIEFRENYVDYESLEFEVWE